MRYEKDLIHFHTLMESVREYRKISTEMLCKGLYSTSQMHYIQNGDRLPDYLMRNRIMARLGISSEGYEDYVQYDEYERWENREELISLIEDSRWDEARILYNRISKSWARTNKIEKQFLLDMEARLLLHDGADLLDIYNIYSQIVNITIGKELPFTKDNRLILSPTEIYYVIYWLYYTPTTEKSLEEILEAFESLINCIENSFWEDIAKAKVLPFAVHAYYQVAKINKAEIDYNKIWIHSELAINSLRKTERFYYLNELVLLREDASRNLNISTVEFEQERDVVDTLGRIKQKYKINIPMAQSGYIYRDSIVNCVADVIHDRRRMLGITREELAVDICSLRTIERIEAKKSKPQQFVMKGIFEKLNLLAEYRRAQIVTDDINVINEFNSYRIAVNQENFDIAFAKINNLISCLDKKYIANKQAIIRMINVRKRINGQIDIEQYIKNLETAWSLSIRRDISNRDFYYLTDGEIVLLHNIARQSNNNDGWQRTVLNSCLNYSEAMLLSHFPSFELVKDWEASELGNKGLYKESNLISEIIIETTFRLNRFHGIYRALYNVCWNMYEEYKTEAASKEFNKAITDCINICDFCNNGLISFYKSELK